MSRAEKISVGIALFGAGVTVVFGALNRGDVQVSPTVVTLAIAFGIALMFGGSAFATVSWLTGKRAPRDAGQETSAEETHRPSPTPSSASLAPSKGVGAGPPKQVRPTRDNAPERPVPPTVPPPPTLPPGYPARGDLARALRVLATEGDELAHDPEARGTEQATTRGQRKEWAQRVRTTLSNAALPSHASYFFETTPRTLPSSENLLVRIGIALRGEEEIKSGWRLEERLAKLRGIVAQLEEAEGS